MKGANLYFFVGGLQSEVKGHVFFLFFVFLFVGSARYNMVYRK